MSGLHAEGFTCSAPFDSIPIPYIEVVSSFLLFPLPSSVWPVTNGARHGSISLRYPHLHSWLSVDRLTVLASKSPHALPMIPCGSPVIAS